ncbi:hypothetical protein [Dactylosporangium sp. NPDC005555]|uniref:hypothetical protein n=1 Tax=Dactylosporangium sp. NPDC005555 TaxID=3154889 RepID=UPI0033BC376A
MSWRLQAVEEVVTDDDRAWQGRADRTDAEALPAMRALAGRWAATIGALTGLLGLTALAGGPRTSDQLDGAWRIVIGALVLLAVLAAATATWLAADAHGGSVQRVLTTYDRLREGHRAEIGRVHRRFRWSKLATAAAMAALIVAAGLAWFAPKPEDQVLIVRRGGQLQCLPLKDGATISVVLDAQATVTVAPNCPSS